MNIDRQSYSLAAANMAVRALIEEVELTPKPGLVDKRNTGAHQDLTIQLMRASAKSLKDTFEKIAYVSYGRSPSQSLREEIAMIGRCGEERMFEVTCHVNTHKGAIWAIGLLVSAAAMGKGTYGINQIVKCAGELACFSDRFCPITQTNGKNVFIKYGAKGAREEAMQGFPHIMHLSLPILYRSRASGLTEEKARLFALLSLIANLDDTCILHRGGLEALSYAKTQAAQLLTSRKLENMYKLDEDFIQKNISPGGSADLLAATIFLDEIQALQTIDHIRNEYTVTN